MFLETVYLRDLDRIDGRPMEFEWKNFPGFATLEILAEIQKMMAESKCEPVQNKGRISFMSMYNDIAWGERDKFGEYTRQFQKVTSQEVLPHRNRKQ